MKKLILTALLVLLITSNGFAAEKKFKGEFTFYENSTNVSIDSFELVESRQLTPLNKDGGNYRFSFKTSSGETIYEGKRLVSFRIMGPPGPRSDEGYSDTVDTRSMSFLFNYSSDMEIFEIRKNGQLVKTVNIPDKICSGQNICNQYCADNGVTSESCELDQKQVEGDKKDIPYILVTVAIFGIIIFILSRKKNENNLKIN